MSEISDGELLPCPFCGCAVSLERRHGDKLYVVKCTGNSPCIGSGLGGFYILPEQLADGIAAWNRRTDTRSAEPVAWRWRWRNYATKKPRDWHLAETEESARERAARNGADISEIEPLYATPPAPKPGAVTDQLAALRQVGWSVAVHNDYRLNGEPMTFWLLTHPSGRWVKGEGNTDEMALAICTNEAALSEQEGDE